MNEDQNDTLVEWVNKLLLIGEANRPQKKVQICAHFLSVFAHCSSGEGAA